MISELNDSRCNSVATASVLLIRGISRQYKWWVYCVATLLAFCSCLSFCPWLSSNDNSLASIWETANAVFSLNYAGISIAYLLVFFLSFFLDLLFFAIQLDEDSRIKASSVLLWMLFSAVLGSYVVCGQSLFETHSFLLVLQSPAAVLLSALRFFGIVSLITSAMVTIDFCWTRKDIRLFKNNDCREKHTVPITIAWSWQGVIKNAALLMLLWTPWYPSLWPGSMSIDTVSQIAQVFHVLRPIDHHPFFDSLIFASFIKLGGFLGSYDIGIAIYSILQTIIYALVLSTACSYSKKIGAPRIVCIAELIISAVFPLFPLYSMVMLKDMLFAPFYVIFLICYLEIVRTSGKCLEKKSLGIVFCIASLVAAFAKKPGIVIIAPCLLALAFFLKQEKKWIVINACCIAGLYLTLQFVVFPYWNVSPGESREMFGPLAQQTTLCLIKHPDDVTSGQLQSLNDVMDTDAAVAQYDPTITDPVKHTWYAETFVYDAETSGNKLSAEQQLDVRRKQVNFLATWFSLGVEHPLTYLEAFGSIIAPFIYPSTPCSLEMGWQLPETQDETLGNFYDSLNFSRNYALAKETSAAYESIASTPVFSFLLSEALWASWIPLFCLFSWFRFGQHRLLTSLPLLLTYFVLMLSPVATQFRYCYPLLMSCSTMVGWTCYCWQTERGKVER
jgi:hypothetical protein